jgi:hypothetical protein
MPHTITAILVKEDIDIAVARALDLRPVSLTPSLTMFSIDHYFAAHWQAARGSKGYLDVPAGFPGTFPNEAVLREMVCEATASPSPSFAIIMTEYVGGVGGQWACAFTGWIRSTGTSTTINDALRALGVVPVEGLDEFDSVGLGDHRSQPEYLERYVELCDEIGV